MQLVVLCVGVFALSCFVTATPHGYGVKSGAAVKADAGAEAGAFGEVPLVIPAGTGFSGSFTKSSSSSSSSSSASSSSSSFTYSGSSYPGISKGCSTGVCQNSGTYDKNSETINGNQNNNYNHASPVSVGLAGHAGANAGSQLSLGGNNPSCTGSDCTQKGGDCKGPNCEGVAAGSNCKTGQCDDDKDNDNGCKSGQCGASGESGIKPTNFNMDEDDTYNNNKCQSGQCKISPGCVGGQCAESSTYGNTPSISQHEHSEDTSKGSASTSSNVASTHSSYNPVQSAPSNSYDSEKCTSGHCKYSLTHDATNPKPDNEDIDVNIAMNKKSSYQNNHHENAASKSKIPSNCAFGNCASNPPLSTSYGTHPHSSYNLDKSKCTSPDCNNDAYNHASAAGGSSVPAYNQPSTYLTTPNKGSSCTSPDCKPTSVVPEYHPTGIVPTSSSQSTIPSNNNKHFDCTGGHCADNAPNPPNSYITPSYLNTPVPSTDSGPYNHKCTSPNCATSPQNQSPHNHNVIQTPVPSFVSSSKPLFPTQIPFSPAINNPSQNVPPSQEQPYPSFVPLTPPSSQPCGYNGCHGSVSTKPHYGSNTVPQSNFVQSGSPSSSSISSYPSSAPSIGTSHGIPSLNKPSHKNDKPIYTGGFGGPVGLLKPNDYSLPSTIPLPKPVVEQQPSISCATGNCNNAPNHGHINNVNANAASTIGSFGGPPGLLKPNDYSLPSAVPINNPVTGHHHSVSCTSGNCHNIPNHGHINNANANAASAVGSFAGSSGTLTPNDNSIPSTVPLNNPTGGHHHSVPCSTGKCNDAPNHGNVNNGNANAASAVGSFGGPSGLLKPNDYSVPSTLPPNNPIGGHQYSGPCSTGNCNNAPNHGHINNGNTNAASAVGSFGGPPGLLKPNDYSVPSNTPLNKPASGHHHSVTCSTGNCNNDHVSINNGNSNTIPATHNTICATGKCSSPNGSGTHIVNGAHASAGAAASANAIAYTGGFGGPPGFLKPYDGGNFKSTLVSLHGKSALPSTNLGDNSAYGAHYTYNQGTGSVSGAFASAGASAGAYGGHSGHYNNDDGSGNKTGRGCGGGCSEGDSGSRGSGVNSYLDSGTFGLSAAKAGAVSGAHSGYGGSFASSSASAHAGASVKG
ncbi:unnamed protein product [Diatraea saccharalis]|uniref:Hornerin-like n=1 Tax=Diatraea saccharalis TaxID=40085 RepID=A0A9P0CBV9_9NEOP|nr:unnamed protein product [Diatraea saccharalis]